MKVTIAVGCVVSRIHWILTKRLHKDDGELLSNLQNGLSNTDENVGLFL